MISPLRGRHEALAPQVDGWTESLVIKGLLFVRVVTWSSQAGSAEQHGGAALRCDADDRTAGPSSETRPSSTQAGGGQPLTSVALGALLLSHVDECCFEFFIKDGDFVTEAAPLRRVGLGSILLHQLPFA